MALRAFVDALGGDHSSWRAHEQTTQLTYADLRLPRERAIALPLDTLRVMVDVFGDALRCAFHDGDDLLLRVDASIDGGSLTHLAEQSRGLDAISLQFRLDKERLANAQYSVPGGCRPLLYIYPEAFDALLNASPTMIEERLWSNDAAVKAIVILPARSIFLDGPTLAVVGGDHVGRCAQVTLPDRAEIARLTEMHSTAVEHLHWHQRWVRFLTPRHLDLDGIDEEGTVRGALLRQAARLFVLYTADKSVERDAEILCTYSGPEFSGDVAVPAASAVWPISNETALGIRRVFDWVYEDPTSTKRLSVAQLVFTRHLHFVDASMRFGRLLEVCRNIRDELVWTEKTVMSEALRTYAADVRALEDYIDRTVQSFADQASTVVKSCTDTVLAGLGTAVAALLATLIKAGSSSVVLGIALLVYALYVFVFQIKYNLANQRDREQILAKDFESRRERFKERIYGQNVDHIIGDRLDNARALFQKWRHWALIVLWVVVALGVVSGVVIIAINLGTQPAPTPAVEHTPTAAPPRPTVAAATAAPPIALNRFDWAVSKTASTGTASTGTASHTITWAP